MKDNFACVFTRLWGGKWRLIVLALKVVPDALTGVRSTKPNYVAAVIPRPAEPLNGRVALEAFLPLCYKNLPLCGVISANEFHDGGKIHVLK
jgi:hypothetical protein